MNSLLSVLTIVFAMAGFSVFGFVPQAGAQSAESSPNEIGFYLGEHLPSGIEGVTEILATYGARYGLGLGRAGVAEIGLFNSHSYGTDFTTAELNLRGGLPFAQGVEVIYYGGADFNFFKPENQTERKKEMGYHVGGGAMMEMTDTLWLRGEMKFMGGPGTSLLFFGGLVFR